MTRNSVPQRWCAVGYLRTSSTVSGSPASSAWIVMCSAPWYWKTRWMSGVRETSGQVAQEEPDLDDRPRARAGPSPASTPDVATLEMNSGSRVKTAMRHAERDQQHHDDRALAELDVVLLGLDVGAADQPARADDERLVQDDESAHERPLGGRRGVHARVEPLGGGHDAAVGMAQRHRDRVATAHEHALDEGLAAVGVRGSAADGRLPPPAASVR